MTIEFGGTIVFSDRIVWPATMEFSPTTTPSVSVR